MNNIDDLIKSRKVPPVMLVFGEEDFLVEEAWRNILAILTDNENSGFNTDILDCENSDVTLPKIVDLCNSMPFMDDTRIVVVKNFEKLFSGRKSQKNSGEKQFSDYLDNPLASTKLILISKLEDFKGLANDLKKPKGKSKAEKKIESAKFPYAKLLKEHLWIEYPHLYENELAGWVEVRFNQHGKKITPDACELLVLNTNPNLWELNGEIEKLLAYAGDKKKVDTDDVAIVTGISRQYNVFELQKAVGRKDISKSIEIMENILSTDRQEMLIITMLTRYFTIMFKMLEEDLRQNQFQLASKIGMSPYFVDEYLKAVSKYKPREIENAFRALLDADREMKSTGANSLYIMQKMLIDIIG